MSIEYAPAPPELAANYIQLRGLTRENPISQSRLHALGITAESWARDIRAGQTQGFMALANEKLVGYCFADFTSAEVLVLAVLPDFERQGIGKQLLGRVVGQLRQRGHSRLFLACSADPAVRSYGFYRHLGWHPTGSLDDHGDEILEWT